MFNSSLCITLVSIGKGYVKADKLKNTNLQCLIQIIIHAFEKSNTINAICHTRASNFL
jgi:hypothetical protein